MSTEPDRMALPPSPRDAQSPNRQYRLRIESDDGWRSPQPLATLARRDAAGAYQTLWSRRLPHHHGPRALLLNDAGAVLLVDEWIHVRSRHALMLLDAANRVLRHSPHDEVLAALGVSLAELATQARLGPWLSAPPRLSEDQQHGLIAAGGRVLRVELRSGALSLQ